MRGGKPARAATVVAIAIETVVAVRIAVNGKKAAPSTNLGIVATVRKTLNTSHISSSDQ